MLKNIREFVIAVDKLKNIEDAYEIIEHQCTEELKALIYSLANDNSPEPFRSAMINIGFTKY